jgi:WD40 repeat protein
VLLWDPAAGAVVGTLHGSGGAVTHLAFGDGGRTLAAVARRPGDRADAAEVCRWEVPGGRALPGFRLPSTGPANVRTLYPHACAYSADGGLLAALGASRKSVELYDTATGHKRATPTDAYPARGVLTAVALAPGGEWLAAAASEADEADRTVARIRVWDARDGRLVRSWVTATTPERTMGTLEVHTLAFTPDGRTLAVGTEAGRVALWAVASGEQLLALPPVPWGLWVHALAFAPDGQALAAGSKYGGAVLYRAPRRP